MLHLYNFLDLLHHGRLNFILDWDIDNLKHLPNCSWNLFGVILLLGNPRKRFNPFS